MTTSEKIAKYRDAFDARQAPL